MYMYIYKSVEYTSAPKATQVYIAMPRYTYVHFTFRDS